MKVVAIIAGIILVVAWIFYVASNAVPSWSSQSSLGVTDTYGLWQACRTYSTTSTCANINCPASGNDNGYCGRLMAGRAFMTLACIFSGIAAICLLVCAFADEKISRILTIAGKVLAIVCVIMGIIGVATGGSAQQVLWQGTNQLNFTAGFGLGIVAIIINIVGFIVSLFVK
ncbi:unnamed protein product [Adineta steineri]|uniref:Uncharacterized protein n=1 Tax=Adineta steineri TaxID=433720 RepID=A0A818LH32_9BILA|nr:unnamed protein product [Adineta steineri]CAF3574422.1 unnamed protein product [Adineta steineri]